MDEGWSWYRISGSCNDFDEEIARSWEMKLLSSRSAAEQEIVPYLEWVWGLREPSEPQHLRVQFVPTLSL